MPTYSMKGRAKAKKKADPPLRNLVQQRLLDDVFHSTMGQTTGWSVLVVDHAATRVMSTAIGMYDLMEQRVCGVEDLTKKRAPFRDMSVIYLIGQKEDSVNRLIADWTRSDPLYGKMVFVYFLGRLPDNLLEKIKQCKPLLRRLKALGELNVDFLAKEERAFHFDMRSSFTTLFRRTQPTVPELDIVEKLVTVCATLNEYPHIRYRGTSDLCTSLASFFHQKMNEFVGRNEKWWYHGDATHTDRDRSTLLLLDRSDDCLSPLMHEFTYQAMVTDLLPMEDDVITYRSETFESDGPGTMKKDVILNDNDEVWVELRGKHIADVVQILSDRIRDVVNSGTGSALNKKDKGTMSLSQMASTLKELPEYREVMSKLSQHMHIAHQCLDIFKKEQLLDLSELEQTLATGQTDEGRKPKLAEMVDLVEDKLRETRNPRDKVRLLAIFTTSQKGIRPADRERLLAAAQLSPADQQVLDNLGVMGVPLVSRGETKKITSFFGNQGLASSGVVDEGSEYAGSRYQPLVKSILDDIGESRLSIEDYPSVLPLPEVGGSTGTAVSARSRSGVSARRSDPVTSRWKRNDKAKNNKKAVFSGGRQIIFMVGGMCYSELRCIREVNKTGTKEIVAGSTHFLKPKEFLEDLGALSR